MDYCGCYGIVMVYAYVMWIIMVVMPLFGCCVVIGGSTNATLMLVVLCVLGLLLLLVDGVRVLLWMIMVIIH